MMTIATCCPSEEISLTVWHAAMYTYVVSAGLAAVAVCALFSRGRLFRYGLSFALAAILAGLFPLCFAAYVYAIDYVNVACDGTPASRPLLVAMAIPCIPVVVAGFVSIGWLKRRSKKGEHATEI